jgi:hypothetical protein
MILPDQWAVRPRNPGCVCTAKTAFIEESHGGCHLIGGRSLGRRLVRVEPSKSVSSRAD